MKKLLFLIPFLASSLLAETDVIGPFSTLNNTDTSVTLASGQSQDLLNVDITPGGKSVKKRKGYGLAFTLNNTTSPVHGIYNFYDANGADVSLLFNDYRLSVSVSGAAPTVFFSTGSLNATYQCVDSAGFAYCANTGRTSLLKINASAATSIQTVASTGTMVAVTPERLVSAGFSEAPSRIDFSKSNDFTTWTPGGLPTDPINFTIVSPGSRITHITYAHSRVYWFKDSSFGYILPGPTQGDWIVRTVNSFVGTLYNTSVFRDDVLYFQGQDGHFYAFDGTSLKKMSRDIQGTIDVTQGRSAGSWNQTSAADWNAGSFDSSKLVDTDTVSGNITTLFPDPFTTLRDGQSGTRAIWVIADNGPTVDSTVTISAGQALFSSTATAGASTGRATFRTQNSLPFNGTGNFFYHFDLNSATMGDSADEFYFELRQGAQVDASFAPSSQTTYWYLRFTQASAGTIRLEDLGTNATDPLNRTYGLTYTLPIQVDLVLSQTNYTIYVNSLAVAFGTHSWTQADVYPAFWLIKPAAQAISSYVKLDNFTVSPQTFTFVSAVKNAAALTSWDTFAANYSYDKVSGNAHTFSVRAATGVFTVNSSTPSWTAINSGSIPSISTGSYFQIRDAFATTSTNSATLSDFTQNWFEGAATDKTYACYNDNSLWWSVASGTGATTNNRILKYDLLNNGWLLYDIPTNGMFVRNQRLYFGSPSSGYVYKFGDATSDNGSAINAYWKSKDLIGVSPFIDKDYSRLSFSASSVSNSSMTVTYAINGSSSTSFVVPLANSSASFIKKNRNLQQGSTGDTFNVKFGNNAADQQFEIFAVGIDYTPKSWIPQ